MMKNETVVKETGFKDKKTTLVLFGILQIILGGLLVSTVIGSIIINKAHAEVFTFKRLMPTILMHSILAIWFIWIGIGSIKTLRWARALTLTSSWPWLIFGILGFGTMLLIIPNIYEQMGKNGKMSESAVFASILVMITFMASIYVVLPSLFILFYSSRDVKATCEYRDPHIRWTDKCPLPVLIASIVCAIWSFLILRNAAYGWILPFFGTIMSGVSGSIAISIISFLLAYAAIGMYKLDKKAWWIAFVVIACLFLSNLITFLGENMQTLLKQMNLPSRELEIIKRFYNPKMIILAIVQLGYIVYIRRYFNCSQDEDKQFNI